MSAQDTTPKRPKYKHGGVSMLAGQIVGALYSIPYKVLPEGFEDWSPFFESEHTQGILFGLVSWVLYELYELRRKWQNG